MKLASYDDGSRDGQLLVVSRDLTQAHCATAIAGRLQQVLDDWGFLSPQLQDLYTQLNHGRLRHAFDFDPAHCLAPLPRAFQWASAAGDALTLQRGASDDFLGPCAPARFASETMGIAFTPGVAVITGDVAQGASAAQALEGVRLLILLNDWRLEAVAGLQGCPATSVAPVAVTPDELGEDWRGGRVGLALQAMRNGRKLAADVEAPVAAFGPLIAHLAGTRRVRAGSVVGALGGALSGAASSVPLKFGDSIRIDIKGRDGQSVFGAIDQDITSTQTTP